MIFTFLQSLPGAWGGESHTPSKTGVINTLAKSTGCQDGTAVLLTVGSESPEMAALWRGKGQGWPVRQNGHATDSVPSMFMQIYLYLKRAF